MKRIGTGRLPILVLWTVLNLFAAYASAAIHQEDKTRADTLLAEAGERVLAGRVTEGKAALGEALLLYQKLADLPGQASCYLLQGFAETGAGNQASAARSFEQSVSLLEKLGDRFSAWMALWMLAELEGQEGQIEQAISHHERALALLDELESSSEPLSLAGFKQLARVFGLPAEQLEQLDKPLMAQVAKPLLTRYAQAISRDGYGGALVEAGRLQEAESQLTQAAELSRLFGGMFDRSIFARLGHLRRRQWRLDEARESYKKALDGLKQLSALPFVRDPRMEVQALDRLAEIESLAGRLEEALAWNDRALALVYRDQDCTREAAVLQDRAEIHLLGGQYDAAEETLNKALILARENDNIFRQATLLVDLANLAMLRGSYEAAARHLENAVAFFHRLNEPYVEAGAWTLLSEVYLLLEAQGSASGTLAAAVERARESGFRLAQALAESVAAWGRFRSHEADLSSVRESFEAFLKLAEAEGLMLGGNLRALFQEVLSLDGSPSEAASSASATALGWTDLPGLPRVPSVPNFLLGKEHFERGDLVKARELWSQALEEARNLGHKDLMASLTMAVAVCYWKEGKPEEAIQHLVQAVGFLEESAEEIQVEDLRTAYLGSEKKVFYEILIDMLVGQGRREEAFEYTERARARAFLQLIGNRRLKLGHGADANLLTEAEALRATITDWQRQSLRPAARQRTRLAEDLRNARQRYEHLRTRLKVSNPEYTSLLSIDPLRLGDIHRELPPDITLISYFVTSSKVHAWVLDREAFQHVPLPMDRTDLRRAVCWADKVGRRHGGRGIQPYDAQCGPETVRAEELYEKLMAPLAMHLRHRNLVLIPHAELHYLPFAALRDPKTGRYLIEDYTLTYAPSASVLRFLRGKESPVEGRALVLGAPEQLDPRLEPLPEAAREAEVVGQLIGSPPELGKQAKESRLYRLAGKVDLLHIAAHGVYESRNPVFSRIALAPDKEVDGNLEVHEIFADLDLSGVNLVVLSACQTARGERSRGDEITSLTRAFLYAGSPGVLSTLWNIHDAASAVLMEQFYRHLLDGVSAAEALREAQLGLLRNPRYNDPYYWAAFGLTGDPQGRWRQPQKGGGSPVEGGAQ